MQLSRRENLVDWGLVWLGEDTLELFEKPESDFVESGFFSFVDHPETGPTWLPGRPWRFSAARGSSLRPSPCVGEHSKEVLMNELDLSEEDYQTLVDKGITGTVYER